MKKIQLSVIAFSLFYTLQAQTLDRSVRPKPGPAPEIKLGDAESFVLPNGLKVFVVENHKLPAVTYSIQLDIKPELQPAKAGLENFVGELITSGTITRSKDRFDEETDFISANIGAGSSNIYGRALTKYQDKMLDLLTDALINANFKQSDLDKLKKQALAGLEAGKNEPAEMMDNVSSVLNYGPNHPYGQVTTEQTINNVSLADCEKFYRTYFRPNVAYMAIVGDITLEKAKEMANKYFAKWPSADVPKATYEVKAAPQTTEVAFVPRDGAVQSVVSITYPIDLKIGTPNVIKAKVLNQVLGGSFQRLDRNLRETHAWTYGSNSSISPDELVGNVDIGVKCRNEVTDSSITEMLAEMNTLRQVPLKAEELQGAINFLSGVFALGLENPMTLAQYAINIERYHMPKDYYKNYLKNLSATTIADIQDVAQKYLLADNAHIVVVGNKSEIEKLKKFSKNSELKFYDNYGNPIAPIEVKVINGMGIDQVLDKYIAAIGGKAAIESLQNLTISQNVSEAGQEYVQNVVIASPDKQKVTISVNGQVVQKFVINGETGYMEAQGHRQALPPAMVAEHKADADLQQILHPAKYGITYTLAGTENVDNKDAYVVEKVEMDGKKRTVQCYDMVSGLIIREIVKSEENGQPKVEVKTISDYREVKNGNGFKMPFSEKGATGETVTVQSAKANGNVSEATFK
ncbi:MAG: pitrilysin family protein [Edaphocola sp.]